MTLERTLVLDLNPESKMQYVKVKQGDVASNVFTVSFVNSINDSAVTIAPGQMVRFRCLKPSGASCSSQCVVDGGAVTLTMDAESTAESGLCRADITIEENNIVLSSAPFWLEVVKSAVSSRTGGGGGGGGLSIVCQDDGEGNITISV